MKIVIFGLTITSSWGNGHATLWRGLCRALARRGHTLVFFERDVPYYAAHRDLQTWPDGELQLFQAWEDVIPVARRHLDEADVALAQWRIDVVHLHGIDFHAYLPPPGQPTLVTPHLPPSFFSPEAFALRRPNTFLHCVSSSQRKGCPPGVPLLPEIGNGVALDDSPRRAGYPA